MSSGHKDIGLISSRRQTILRSTGPGTGASRRRGTVLVVFGTRPEAIKLAPVIHGLKSHPSLSTVVCATFQHREMLRQCLRTFRIRPDYDLKIMEDDQTVFDVTSRVLIRMRDVLSKVRPAVTVVQGDTTTAMAASVASYYLKIPVSHVEAGLRTNDKYAPFPEEINRRFIGSLADFHFAPTPWAKENLIREGVDPRKIRVTGNTVVDALFEILGRQRDAAEAARWERYFRRRWGFSPDEPGRRILLVTGHRRESFGEGFRNICLALRDIAERHREVRVVYPVHLNPNVQRPVREILGPQGRGPGNVALLDPLGYEPFVYLMKRSHLILTDSGGIQEEAPSLGKPVLVMREKTERPEGVDAGVVRIVGTRRAEIVRRTEELLGDREAYRRMAKRKNPYGDGRAAGRIVTVLARFLSRAVGG